MLFGWVAPSRATERDAPRPLAPAGITAFQEHATETQQSSRVPLRHRGVPSPSGAGIAPGCRVRAENGHRSLPPIHPTLSAAAQATLPLYAMRFIPTGVHAVLDYLVGALLIASPWLFGFAAGGAETWVPVVLGTTALVMSVLTDYELGLIRTIPMPTHLVQRPMV